MQYAFEPGQEVQVAHPCVVIGYSLPRGLKGRIYSVNDVLGEPIFRVKFENDWALPMRADEIVLVGQPVASDD